MTKYIIGAFALLIIGGCVQLPPPSISDIRDSMVKVRVEVRSQLHHTAELTPEVQAEANRGCEQYNKRAEVMSYYCVYRPHSCTVWEFLFACK